MHCGHCIRAITRAVQALDPAARVHVDLAAGTVDVESDAATPPQILEAIGAEGYAATVRP
jgi:copper chaperone